MTNAVNERELCLDVLMEVTENGTYVHQVLGNVLERHMYLDKRQRSFISRVSEGTIEYLLQLDVVINRYSKTKTPKMKPLIRNLLRISAYQLLYMDNVPDSAICNEAVKIACKRRFHGLKGFVNGVLRTISREKENIAFETLWERYSMPQWLVQMWEQRYGAEVTERMLSDFLQPKKMSIRCNLTKCMPKDLAAQLSEEGAMVEKAPYVDAAYYIGGFDTLYSLESFRQGYFQVQDVSSMLVALAAKPEQGDVVIDMCAAPGGKSLHAADLLHGTGRVIARDLTEYKAGLIEDNRERCGFDNLEVQVWDATQFDPDMEGKADIVLADLPCSGLGVIGRKADIKYRISPEQIEQLQHLQREMLDVAWRYVKAGGTLIYSTCTISRMENEENVQWLLENYPLEPVSLAGCDGFAMEADTLGQGYVQLLPGIHNTDGFFIAKFKRMASSNGVCVY